MDLDLLYDGRMNKFQTLVMKSYRVHSEGAGCRPLMLDPPYRLPSVVRHRLLRGFGVGGGGACSCIKVANLANESNALAVGVSLAALREEQQESTWLTTHLSQWQYRMQRYMTRWYASWQSQEEK